MLKIFNFSTLNCYLDQTTRSLHVFIDNGEHNYFNSELLFEFETLVAWVNEHIEISALFIASNLEQFSDGIDPELLSSLNRDQLENFLIRLRKINLKLTQLAQTIVIDVGSGCANVAAEFILCADIRISRFDTKIKFDHHYLGLIPASGGISLLSELTNPNFAKSWILGGTNISIKQLTNSGLIFETYQDGDAREKIVSTLLNNFQHQSSLSRIQSKFGLSQLGDQNPMEKADLENSILKAFVQEEEWLKAKEKKFANAKEVKQKIQLKLIKNETIN